MTRKDRSQAHDEIKTCINKIYDECQELNKKYKISRIVGSLAGVLVSISMYSGYDKRTIVGCIEKSWEAALRKRMEMQKTWN